MNEKYNASRRISEYGRTKTNIINNYEDYNYDPSYVPKYSHLMKVKTDVSEVSPYPEKKYNFTYQ